MGIKVPFVPSGTCGDCKFSAMVGENHYQYKYQPLRCYRFPPAGNSHANGDGPWNHPTYVTTTNTCGEFQPE